MQQAEPPFFCCLVRSAYQHPPRLTLEQAYRQTLLVPSPDQTRADGVVCCPRADHNGRLFADLLIALAFLRNINIVAQCLPNGYEMAGNATHGSLHMQKSV